MPAPLVSFLPIMLIGILFGLAMDYAVFLVSRVREDFDHDKNPQQAIISGLGHNARVITAAALIMMSVFAGFMLAPDPVIKSVGFALAVGVFIDAFIVRMSLAPAVMSLPGRAAWWLPPRWTRSCPTSTSTSMSKARSVRAWSVSAVDQGLSTRTVSVRFA